jgi:hypothetical protein
MKTAIKLILLTVVFSLGLLTLPAADRIAGGPKGGRLLEKTEPRAEFFVGKDRTVTINFYNHDMKPVAATTQAVTVIANAKSGKETLQFEKRGDSLVSKTKLPEGEDYNLVVQFKQTADAKPMNLRFKLDMHTCGECKRSEYACACGH